MKLIACLLAFMALAAFARAAPSADMSLERTDDGVTVELDGKPFTRYLFKGDQKPVLYPVIGPTGHPLTRPPEKVRDHPHHFSFWFTHGNVNGHDFWHGKKGARIVHRELVKAEVVPASSGGDAEEAVLVTRSDWLAGDGKVVCREQRTMAFGTWRDSRRIDVDVTISAADEPVTFGETKEGSFGVRVYPSMRVDAGKGGHIVNSRGDTDGDAWSKQAEWVDYHGPVDGKTVGIAILQHPTSFRFPTRWHVRPYGLFAVNPFMKGKGGEQTATSHTLKPAGSFTLRFRVLLHEGDEKAARIAKAFADYAARR